MNDIGMTVTELRDILDTVPGDYIVLIEGNDVDETWRRDANETFHITSREPREKGD